MDRDKIIKSLQSEILKLQVDAILIKSSANIYYLSGFRGDSGSLILTPYKKYIVVDDRFKIQAANECPDFELILTNTNHNVSKLLKELKITRLGLEYSCINLSEYESLKSAIEYTIDIDKILLSMRSIKSEYELNCIEKACGIGDRAFTYILDMISNNVGKITEKELSVELDYFMLKTGADKVAFETIVASGINTAIPHAIPSDKIINTNEFVLLDFGCKYRGYCSDMTRTIHIGSINDNKKNSYNAVLVASNISLDNLQHNVSASIIDIKAREYFSLKNMDQYFVHGLGHGVGLDIHEFPTISKTSIDTLKRNMAFTIEPGIYIPDMYGIRIEETAILSEFSINIATKSIKKLILL